MIIRIIRTAALLCMVALGMGSGVGIAGPGELLWKYKTAGQIWSSATAVNGTLYFGSDDGQLYALRSSDAKLEWRFATGGLVRCKPAVTESHVYFCSDDGFLYCVNREDGREHWRFDMESADLPRVLPSPDPPYSYDYIQSSPLHLDGMVFIGGASGFVYAVEATSGNELWRFETGGLVRSSARAAGDAIVIGSWDGQLYSLERRTGRLNWKTDTGGALQATPAVGEGRVFIGSRNPKVFALDTGSGDLLWEHVHGDGSWVESSGVLREDVLYIGSSDALALFAFAAETGELLWNYRTGSWAWSTPAVLDDLVLIGGVSAEPYYFPGVTLDRGLWAVDRRSGEELWHYKTDKIPGYITGGVFATPIVVNDIVYFGSLDGNMYALRLGDPSEERIKIGSGGWDIIGDLRLTKTDAPTACVLLMNQAGGNRDAYRALAGMLAEQGIASLRIDLRGHGESVNLGRFLPGEEESIPFPWDSEADVAAAHEFLKTHPAIDPDRIAMVGASYSGEEMAEAGRLGGYCRAYAALSPGSFSEESIRAIDPSGIPWLIVIAKEDPFLQSHLEALEELSDEVELLLSPGTTHGTEILEKRREIAEDLTTWVLQQLEN